ncbi:ABC transporter ATP-binding protein [Ignicoccus islandicus]|uniref:ABC transporter ATP-binding protein n=1 Tax=Ignicoccus islandicus TaxID=54259 RepID=UPI0009462CB4|nr:ABC transporter ATP-binding protein [Ignicoccus islandicus]
MKALEVRNLSFSYKKRPILSNVNLDVSHPSIVAIIGPNGSGKSTFAKVIVGQLKGEGEVRIFNKIVLSKGIYLPPSSRGLAYVPQRSPVFPHLTVKENLEFVAKNATPRLIEEVMGLFELEPISDLKGKELSGGQAKRLSIAMAFASGKELIIMDEPLSGVDPSSRESLVEVVRELAKKRKVSILWITHFKEVMEKCDEVYMMDKGFLIKID